MKNIILGLLVLFSIVSCTNKVQFKEPEIANKVGVITFPNPHQYEHCLLNIGGESNASGASLNSDLTFYERQPKYQIKIFHRWALKFNDSMLIGNNKSA